MNQELKKTFESFYINKYKVTPEMQKRLFVTTNISVGGTIQDSYVDPAIKNNFQTFTAGWLIQRKENDFLIAVLEKINKSWNRKHDFKEMHKALITIMAIIEEALK